LLYQTVGWDSHCDIHYLPFLTIMALHLGHLFVVVGA